MSDDSDILWWREMNEGNFAVHDTKIRGNLDGIFMEFCMRISEDKNQSQKLMYIPRFLSSGLYGSLVT